MSQEDVEDARARFGAVLDRGFEIEPSEEVRAAAIVLALAGTVRSADALQLAAGLTAHRIAGSAAFVTFDDRLAEVARSHGLTVLARIP